MLPSKEEGEKKIEECREEMNYWSVKYNEGLMSMLQELKSELKETYYSFSDSYKVFLDPSFRDQLLMVQLIIFFL